MKIIIFIISTAHSGSTLLDMIIGAYSGEFSLGEIVNFPKAANSKTEPCVTRIPVCRCTFWKTVVDKLKSSYKIENLTDNLSLHLTKTDKIRLLLPIFDRKNLQSIFNNRNFKFIKDLYESVFENSQANLLIDSSKNRIRPIYFDKLLTNEEVYPSVPR
jgi:hypothetical protein